MNLGAGPRGSRERIVSLGIVRRQRGGGLSRAFSQGELSLDISRRDRARIPRLRPCMALPVLEERRPNRSTLSGGEQQMLAIGRALMASPAFGCSMSLLGIAPMVTRADIPDNQGAECQRQYCSCGARLALAACDRAYILETDAWSARPGRELLESEVVKRSYLGGRGEHRRIAGPLPGTNGAGSWITAIAIVIRPLRSRQLDD